MPLSARKMLIIFVLFTALVASCSPGEATPEPTVTKTRPPTLTPLPSTTVSALGSTQSPYTGTLVATAGTPARTGGTLSNFARDPLIPIFGSFPPRPIPARPSNINPLTGLAVDPVTLQRRPILVRIGNDEKVRTSSWQAGFNSADLVFEELIDQIGASYANTRYTAVYLGKDPPLVGPVRSGRIFNFQIAPMMDGALSHAGASNGTRWLFSQSPMINLDEFFNQSAYCYVQSHGYQGRLYTTGPRLREWMVKKGWENPIPLFGFSFSETAPSGKPIQKIALTKSPWPRWNQVEWRYDNGKYMRFVTGSAQVDNSYPVTAKWGNGADCIVSGPATKTQVTASNVVVLYAKHEKTNIIEDSNNAVSVHIIMTGQGDAQFFRDGIAIAGKWLRNTEQEFFLFTDTTGNPIVLKPGTTWFEIVPTGYTLDLK